MDSDLRLGLPQIDTLLFDENISLLRVNSTGD
jgi:hypothetical protein